jgi:2-keto-myo-inositol isomerase
LSPAAVRSLAERHHVQVSALNALQKFNLPERLASCRQELAAMAQIARSIGCRAIVLCPNNDRSDKRTAGEASRDTVQALKALRPVLEDAGVAGYVEPLGFPESSLNSVFLARQAIGEAGGGCYKIVYDTFHHYLGPDTPEEIESSLDVSMVGIVHASGVEEQADKLSLRDEHRLLITESDRLGNLTQIARLTGLGYTGTVSLECFSPQLHQMDQRGFLIAAKRCVQLLTQ